MKIPTVLNFGNVSYILEGEKMCHKKFLITSPKYRSSRVTIFKSRNITLSDVLQSTQQETHSPSNVSNKIILCNRPRTFYSFLSYSLLNFGAISILSIRHWSISVIAKATDVQTSDFFLILQIQSCLGNDDLNLSLHLFYIKIAAKRLRDYRGQ